MTTIIEEKNEKIDRKERSHYLRLTHTATINITDKNKWHNNDYVPAMVNLIQIREEYDDDGKTTGVVNEIYLPTKSLIYKPVYDEVLSGFPAGEKLGNLFFNCSGHFKIINGIGFFVINDIDLIGRVLHDKNQIISRITGRGIVYNNTRKISNFGKHGQELLDIYVAFPNHDNWGDVKLMRVAFYENKDVLKKILNDNVFDEGNYVYIDGELKMRSIGVQDRYSGGAVSESIRPSKWTNLILPSNMKDNMNTAYSKARKGLKVGESKMTELTSVIKLEDIDKSIQKKSLFMLECADGEITDKKLTIDSMRNVANSDNSTVVF